MKDRLVYIALTRLVKDKSYADFIEYIDSVKESLFELGFKIQTVEWDEVSNDRR